MHKSDIFLSICLSFLGGIFFASFFIEKTTVPILLILVISFSLIGIYWKRKQSFVGVLGIFFSFGIFCFSNSILKVENFSINNFHDQNVFAVGRVVEIFEGSNKQELVIDILTVNDMNENIQWGRVLVYADRYLDIKYGSLIKIEGMIKRPENFSNFDYKGYLAKDGISSISVFPKITILVEGKNNMLIDVKQKISNAMDGDFLPSQSPIMQAMVLGESKKMSSDQKQKLAKSGISHAIAISGSHFILIASFLFASLFLIGFWKKASMIITIILIAFYILLISFPSSAVRAGVMIACVYLAKILDRNTEQWRVLLFAAFFMCLNNPLIMKYDLGFQLSFLAVAGLIFLSPIINQFLEKKLKLKSNYLRELVSSTFAAQIFVLPLLFHVSQTFSIFSFIANLLIIPVMPICLALGFLYSLLFWIPIVSKIISFFLFPLISFIMFIADYFSATPFINYEFSFFLTVLSYLILSIFIWTKKKKYRF